MLKDSVVAMLVVHVDDIKIAATKEVTDSVVFELNKRFPTKHLGEVMWYMGSEYRRDREKGTLEISQTCLLYTSPSPRDGLLSRMPSSA